MNESYEELLERKRSHRIESGFDVDESQMSEHLFPFQKFCIRKALKNGRYALFEGCGLGKATELLEFGKHVVNHTNKPVITFAPLAVVSQIQAEAAKFGYDIPEEIDTTDGVLLTPRMYITNYENIDDIDPELFVGVICDESSILKSLNGSTRNTLIHNFRNTPYKLCCTATPSPNDVTELCNHAEFLNVMTRPEMLAMYFVHDGGKTSDWRLKGHAKKAFWDFVSTWAIMIDKPSDIGFSDEGYDLPPLNIISEEVKTPKKDDGRLFNVASVNATDYHKELRATYDTRLDKVAEIANRIDDQVLIWISHDEEGKYLRERIPGAVEVKGSDSKQYKKDKLIGFGRGDFRVLITKLKIAQFGMNYQSCHNQIFASLDFSFESTYQGIRRSYRFGQVDTVNIHLVTTDTMANVKTIFEKKQASFLNMQREMTESMCRFTKEAIGLVHTAGTVEMIIPNFLKSA